jgi:hypothetical protein
VSSRNNHKFKKTQKTKTFQEGKGYSDHPRDKKR